jgi:hypothetical protein
MAAGFHLEALYIFWVDHTTTRFWCWMRTYIMLYASVRADGYAGSHLRDVENMGPVVVLILRHAPTYRLDKSKDCHPRNAQQIVKFHL